TYAPSCPLAPVTTTRIAAPPPSRSPPPRASIHRARCLPPPTSAQPCGSRRETLHVAEKPGSRVVPPPMDRGRTATVGIRLRTGKGTDDEDPGVAAARAG